MRMYPASEFPKETFPEIVRKNGTVSRAALKMHFSAIGCPTAKPELAAAAIKAGYDVSVAIQIAMLADYASGLSIDCVDRTCRAILHVAKRKHAQKFPHGKWAEDMAARREGRPSRWGTPEFHSAA